MFVTFLRRYGIETIALAVALLATVLSRWYAFDDLLLAFVLLGIGAVVMGVGAMAAGYGTWKLPAVASSSNRRALVVFVVVALWIGSFAPIMLNHDTPIAFACWVIDLFSAAAFILVRMLKRMRESRLELLVIGAAALVLLCGYFVTPIMSRRLLVWCVGPSLEKAVAKPRDADLYVTVVPPTIAAYGYNAPGMGNDFVWGFLVYDSSGEPAAKVATHFAKSFDPNCRVRAEPIEDHYFDLRADCD